MMKRTASWPVYTGWIIVYPTNNQRVVPFCSFGPNIYATQKEAWAHADGVNYTVAKVEVCLPPLWGGSRQLAEEQAREGR